MRAMSKREVAAARFEVCIARIPDAVTDQFISDSDAGKFRILCRGVGVPEDVIDEQIKSLERVADMIPDSLKGKGGTAT